MKRIIIPNYGPDKTKVPIALAAGITTCKQLKTNVLTLIMPSKEAMPTTIVGEALGDKACGQLLKGQTFPLGSGISLHFESVSTVKKSAYFELALVIYVSLKDMRIIDSVEGAKAVIYLPWLTEEGEHWKKTWNAEVLGGPKYDHQPQLPPDVETGLQGLTNSINLSTGLGHPSDKQSAKRLFERLKNNKVKYDANEVRIWAIRNGWKPKHADDLMNIAEK